MLQRRNTLRLRSRRAAINHRLAHQIEAAWIFGPVICILCGIHANALRPNIPGGYGNCPVCHNLSLTTAVAFLDYNIQEIRD